MSRKTSTKGRESHPEREGNFYHVMGKFFYQKRNLIESDSYLTRSFKIRKEVKDTKGLVKVIRDLGELYWRLGEPEKIEVVSKEGIELCIEKEDVGNQAKILTDILGPLLERQHRIDEALFSYDKSLSLREIDDLIGKALSLGLIGNILRQKGIFDDALGKYQESLSFAKTSGDRASQVYSLKGIGDTYRDSGEIDKAMITYEEAIKITKQFTDLSSKASFLLNLGTSYRDAGKLDKALELYKQCLQIREMLRDMNGVASILNSIGVLYSTRYSDLNEALKYYEKSLEIRKSMDKSELYTEWVKSNIACVYKRQGKLKEALEIWNHKSKFTAKKDTPQNLNYRGSIYYVRGAWQKAFELHEQSLEICEEIKHMWSKSFTLTHLGRIYIVLGKFEKALNAFRESIQLKTVLFEKAVPLACIGETYYRQGKFAEAMTTCEESLALNRQYGGRIQAGKTLHLMAKIRMKEERYDEALPYVQEAVEIFRDTGSRHLPEAEATLRELQGLGISKD